MLSLLLYHFYLNFILFVHTGHDKFDFIDVQYLQNVIFNFEKGLNVWPCHFVSVRTMPTSFLDKCKRMT